MDNENMNKHCPSSFVCTYCREEFASMDLIFHHLNEMHAKNNVLPGN